MSTDKHDQPPDEVEALATDLFADDEVGDDPFAQLADEPVASLVEPDVAVEAATAIAATDEPDAADESHDAVPTESAMHETEGEAVAREPPEEPADAVDAVDTEELHFAAASVADEPAPVPVDSVEPTTAAQSETTTAQAAAPTGDIDGEPAATAASPADAPVDAPAEAPADAPTTAPADEPDAPSEPALSPHGSAVIEAPAEGPAVVEPPVEAVEDDIIAVSEPQLPTALEEQLAPAVESVEPVDEAGPATPAVAADMPPSDDKDFSDLLAEFEGSEPAVGDLTQAPMGNASEALDTAGNAAAALGLGDDDDFPIGDPDEPAAAPADAAPPVQDSVPTAASLFADEDTAFDIDATDDAAPVSVPSIDDADPFAAVGQKEDGNEPIDFEVPQGWYDDAGEWHWYTDEEREQVRLAMAGQSATWEEPEPSPVPAQSFSPLIPQFSENAARRTPVPVDTATMPSQPSLDAYSPMAATYAPAQAATDPYAPSSHNAYTPAAVASTPSYPAATDGYAPAYGQAAYTPSYAPAQSYASPAHDPYAPTAQASPSAPSAAGPSKAASPPQPKMPAAPRRVASNAYDPPFLKPQKSFVRPPSAAPQPITGFSPALAHATPPAASQVLPPPPPPSGPPRRPKTPAAAPSFEPPPPVMPPPPMPAAVQAEHSLQSPYDDFARVPAAPSASQYETGVLQTSYAPAPLQPAGTQTDTYAPPPVDAYAPPPHDAYAPPPQHQPPPRPTSVPAKQQTKPTFSSFDPPLRPSSVARATSRPNFASPPPRTATPPVMVTPPPGPPAALAAGRASPLAPPRPAQLYEDRQEYAPPRISSPLKPRGSLGTPYDDGRAVRADRSRWEGEGAVAHGRTAVGLDEEVDPEGGQERWDDEPIMSAPTSQAGGAHDHQGNYDAYRSPVEPMRDAYQPSAQSGYNPYDTPQQDMPSTAAQAQYQPYQPPAPSVAENNDPYAASSSLGLQRGASPAPVVHDPYAPGSASNMAGDNSYGSPVKAQATPIEIYNPYATSAKPSGLPNNAYDPYMPNEPPVSHVTPSTQVSRQPPSSYEPSYGAPPPSTGLYAPTTDPYGRASSPAYSSEFGVSPAAPNYFQAAPVDPTYVPQQVLDQRPVSEDPLGRCTMAARNAPLAIFGFGGYIVTAFPAAAEPSGAGAGLRHARAPSYGYASSRGQIWIRPVADVVETSALKSNEAVFPGPLVLDPSATKGAAADKKRKETVVAYLDARAEEIERGLPYLQSSASHAKREAEGKLVVVRLLSALVHGDGKIFGTPTAEAAVRAALQPPASAMTGHAPSAVPNGFGTSPIVAQSSSAAATPAHLAQLSSLLLQGDKRGACGYATEHGLWAHALVISSAVDRELWTETVTRFAASDLPAAEGTAALKAVYALFSGVTTTSVDDLVAAANITKDPSADQWREVVSAVVFNGKPPDLMCLDELGNRLSRLGLVNAAQACYLLSPNSPFSDVSPGAFERQVMLIENTRDDDGTVFAEVAEYARSLVPTPKGVEPPLPSLPQLLPYKLQRAWRAAELGEVDVAQKYCRAVDAASKPGKNARSVLPRHLAASMEDLLERLTGTPSTAPAMATGRKRAKSGATIGSWIEGRLTKFIAGEDDGTAPAKPPPTKGAAAPVGPFSHFSTISPAASGSISRVPSTLDVTHGVHGTSPGAAHQSGHLLDPSRASESSSSSYGDPSYQHGYQSAYSPWTGDTVAEGGSEDVSTPTNYEPYSGSTDGFINPMAAAQASVHAPTVADDYTPPASRAQRAVDEDDDDLGFSNTSLSRGRTPAPAASGGTADTGKPAEKKAETAKADSTTSPKLEQKPSGWLRGWFGKKEGEGSGPIKAKLGEASSMVFDPELKRWVVKGAKGEASAPAATPPPPRAQTVSPSRAVRPDPASNRAMSATPPPSQRPPGAPPNFTSAPSAPPATRSSLAASADAAAPPLPRAPGSAGPPSGPIPNRAPGASLDDLLSRPPSKRPGSAAPKKSARSRYVDVFQQDGA